MTHQTFSLIAITIILLLQANGAHCLVKIVKVTCESLDKALITLDNCFIKAVNRTANYLALKLSFHQIPINNITLRFEVLKRANGWKPFLYKFLVDFCDFLKYRRNPVIVIAYNAAILSTNMPKTCPLNRPSIFWNISNWSIEKALNGLPVPNGEYALFTTWSQYNREKFHLNVYMTSL